MIVKANQLNQAMRDLIHEGQRTFGWTTESVNADFERSDSYYVMHELNGYLGFHLVFETLEIHSVYVDPSARRQGIGRQLVGEALRYGRQKGATNFILEVRSNNHGAQKLYENLAFQPIHRRKNYYQNPNDDAIIMQRIEGGD